MYLNAPYVCSWAISPIFQCFPFRSTYRDDDRSSIFLLIIQRLIHFSSNICYVNIWIPSPETIEIHSPQIIFVFHGQRFFSNNKKDHSLPAGNDFHIVGSENDETSSTKEFQNIQCFVAQTSICIKSLLNFKDITIISGKI